MEIILNCSCMEELLLTVQIVYSFYKLLDKNCFKMFINVCVFF